MKTKCEMCNKSLVCIGINRANGIDCIRDWNQRKFHKKCYKEHILQMELDKMVTKLLVNRWDLMEV
jgi:hypothetical protein